VNAKVGLRLGTVIQPQHSLHHALQRCRQMNAAFAYPALYSVHCFLLQHHAKGLLDIRGRAGKLHRSARRSSGISLDLQVKFFSQTP